MSESPREPGDHDGLPLMFSGSHPEAVRSRGDEMVAFAEARRGAPLRWWQWVCAQRRYEVRADGSWCWPLVWESVPRQQGKTVDLCEDAAWVGSLPRDDPAWRGAFDAEDEALVLHASNNLVLSRKVQGKLWSWADRSGLGVYRLLGDSRVSWPHGTVWKTVAMSGAYGLDASRLLVDEAWDMDPVAFWNAMWPVLGDRGNPQALFFSAANLGDRGLAAGLRGRSDVCRMEWGADPSEDFGDEGVWRAATAFLGGPRVGLMRLARDEPGFAQNWLNVWPAPGRAVGGLVEGGFWASLSSPVSGPVVGVGVESERGEAPVVAVVSRGADGLVVSLRECSSVAESVRVCAGLGVAPWVGKSLLADPGWRDVGAVPATGTARDLAGEFRRLCSDGVLRHDGGGLLSGMVSGFGWRASDRADGLKAAVWGVRAARVGVEEPAVF